MRYARPIPASIHAAIVARWARERSGWTSWLIASTSLPSPTGIAVAARLAPPMTSRASPKATLPRPVEPAAPTLYTRVSGGASNCLGEISGFSSGPRRRGVSGSYEIRRETCTLILRPVRTDGPTWDRSEWTRGGPPDVDDRSEDE